MANKLMHTQEINTEILIGMDDSRIVSDTIHLEKETYSAFIKMKDAAEKDGIIIKLVSGFRDFYRQQMIWNNKYKKFTNEFSLDGPTAIKEIIRFSTIPGTSRHHWGTEIDIIDKNFENEKNLLISKKYEEGGIFNSLKKWMDKNSKRFGFYIVYDDDSNRPGFEYEPWHYTYKPISDLYQREFLKLNLKSIISKTKVEGKEFINDEFIKKYIDENIMGISSHLK
ncbi:M15 family metallopeptidase [Flavobacteriales bacterium]|nr:M15 family metallopeptidase [Flavobacteriales bacterium]